MRMPRGAISTPRSELAPSEPYRPESNTGALESFPAWPMQIGFWGNEAAGNSTSAGEAFAKACAEQGRSLGAKSDNDRQEARRVTAGRSDRCGECLSETGQLRQLIVNRRG